MAKTGSLEYTINDVAITWDERDTRVDKPCGKCAQPTKGRMSTDKVKNIPYHMPCAIDYVTRKALKACTTVVSHG